MLLWKLMKDDYYIFNTENSKFGYRKADLKLYNDDIKEKLKSWETEINEYLKMK